MEKKKSLKNYLFFFFLILLRGAARGRAVSQQQGWEFNPRPPGGLHYKTSSAPGMGFAPGTTVGAPAAPSPASSALIPNC